MSGTNPTVDLQQRQAGTGTFATVALDWLRPGYGLPTRVVTADSVGSPPMVSVIGYQHPETGLATAVTHDPVGQALAETITYEAAGAGSFFRPTSRSRPAGGTTTYEHYGASQSVAIPCTGAGSANQGGRPRLLRAPSPDGGASPAYTSEVVYDAAGRIAASRRNAESLRRSSTSKSEVRARSNSPGCSGPPASYVSAGTTAPIALDVTDGPQGSHPARVATRAPWTAFPSSPEPELTNSCETTARGGRYSQGQPTRTRCAGPPPGPSGLSFTTPLTLPSPPHTWNDLRAPRLA
jgi:hypothetical protein